MVIGLSTGSKARGYDSGSPNFSHFNCSMGSYRNRKITLVNSNFFANTKNCGPFLDHLDAETVCDYELDRHYRRIYSLTATIARD